MGRHGAVTFKGNPLTLAGEEIKVGSAAPAFDLASFGPDNAAVFLRWLPPSPRKE